MSGSMKGLARAPRPVAPPQPTIPARAEHQEPFGRRRALRARPRARCSPRPTITSARSTCGAARLRTDSIVPDSCSTCSGGTASSCRAHRASRRRWARPFRAASLHSRLATSWCSPPTACASITRMAGRRNCATSATAPSVCGQAIASALANPSDSSASLATRNSITCTWRYAATTKHWIRSPAAHWLRRPVAPP